MPTSPCEHIAAEDVSGFCGGRKPRNRGGYSYPLLHRSRVAVAVRPIQKQTAYRDGTNGLISGSSHASAGTTRRQTHEVIPGPVAVHGDRHSPRA